MSNSDYSRLLVKMNELKEISAQYNAYSNTYKPATSTTAKDVYVQRDNINAISNTATPLVIRPGDDYAKYWKYVGKITTAGTDISANAQQCWNKAAADTRLFQKVVYTGARGTNPGQPDWDNNCYGLIYDAPVDASFNTNSTGYATMVGRGNNVYTKLGITNDKDTANIENAAKLNDLQLRVNSLVQEISAVADAGINNELNQLVGSATNSNELISKINTYMNDKVSDISGNYYLIEQRKQMNDVYAEINDQTTLRARKYRFIFYIVLTICIIIGYASYTSKFSLMEQVGSLKTYVSWGWWTYWWIFAIVVILFIVSSFGWDMRGNIMTMYRYVSDPEFWTGRFWWIGVTFLLLIVIFFYATFKSFFVEFDAGMKSVQDTLDGSE